MPLKLTKTINVKIHLLLFVLGIILIFLDKSDK